MGRQKGRRHRVPRPERRFDIDIDLPSTAWIALDRLRRQANSLNGLDGGEHRLGDAGDLNDARTVGPEAQGGQVIAKHAPTGLVGTHHQRRLPRAAAPEHERRVPLPFDGAAVEDETPSARQQIAGEVRKELAKAPCQVPFTADDGTLITHSSAQRAEGEYEYVPAPPGHDPTISPAI